MPTIPDSASVVRKRYRMRKTLRFCSFVLAMIFFIGSLTGIVSGLRYSFDSEDILWSILYLSPFVIGSMLVMIGQGVLTSWIVPLPPAGCPFCRHPALPETGCLCTECGRELPEELLVRPASSTA